jgi:hypothetical protein
MNRTIQKGILFYLLLVLFTLIGVGYGAQVQQVYPDLRVWSITTVGIMLIALPLVALQAQAGLPPIWPDHSKQPFYFLAPVTIGLVFGLLDYIVIECILTQQPHTSLPPYTQPFPYSIFLYGSGAFEIEVFYRLLPITLGGLFFQYYKKGAYGEPGFWVLALLTALREPLEQWPTGPTWFVTYALLTGFGMNFLQAIYLKRFGFWSALLIRLGHYLVWHIGNGLLIEMALQNSGK